MSPVWYKNKNNIIAVPPPPPPGSEHAAASSEPIDIIIWNARLYITHKFY